MVNLVSGAPPKSSSYCPKDDILVGSLVKSLDPLLAFSVYPMKAGIAV